MQTEKKNLILIGLSIVLLIIIAVTFTIDNRQKKQYAQETEQLRAEASPYEKELETLQKELEKKEAAIAYKNEQGSIIFCFQVHSREEVLRVGQLIADNQVVGNIVLDVTMEEQIIADVLQEAAAMQWNVLLTGHISEDTKQRISDCRTLIQTYGAVDSGIFLLDQDADVVQSYDWLLENGYTGFSQITSYGSTLDSGGLENGLVHMEYTPLEKYGKAFRGTVSLAMGECKAAAFLVDMSLFDSSEVNYEADVWNPVMEIMEEVCKEGSVRMVSASEAAEQTLQGMKTQEERQVEYDAFYKEKQPEVEALKSKIDEIYEKRSR